MSTLWKSEEIQIFLFLMLDYSFTLWLIMKPAPKYNLKDSKDSSGGQQLKTSICFLKSYFICWRVSFASSDIIHGIHK